MVMLDENITPFPTETSNSCPLVRCPSNRDLPGACGVKDGTFEIDSLSLREVRSLGRSESSHVLLVEEIQSKELFALKILNKKRHTKRNTLDYVLKEKDTHALCQHPSIIKLLHHFEDSKNFYILMEYAPNGDLFSFIRKNKTLSEEQARQLTYEVGSALAYLHQNGIVHRDLKPENCLLHADGSVAITGK
jgi:serine/threonine protein kinase